jgi:N-acetylmuramoyl-L-alanine amidase
MVWKPTIGDRSKERLKVTRLVRLLAAVVMVIGVAVLAPAPIAAMSPALGSFSVSGTPFAVAFAPLPTQATLTAVLNRRARVTVTIRKPNGTLVRRLATDVRKNAGARSWVWDGRNAAGAVVRDGRYVARIVVKTSAGTEKADRPLRKGMPPIYAANPGAIVVVVDPGHGGRFSGAAHDGVLEKHVNLAIALYLRDLLTTAGVRVVMTRSTDVAVNDPASDLNGDGTLNRYDDDLARNDVANQSLADIAVHVHNNAAPNVAAHGTEAYTDPDRTWTPAGIALATDVVTNVSNTLASYASATFSPANHGTHTGWYYYMGPYDPPFLVRAALMTSVLSESLFVSNAGDRGALVRPDVQLSIAAGIYLGVAQYLNSREYGIGYELVSGPSSAAAASTETYQIRVTNRGNSTSDGWQLTMSEVPAVPLYDGSGAHGTQIGAAPIPDGLRPGQSTTVSVPVTLPGQAGAWLVKSDVIAGGVSLADAGIAPLQFALTTTIAP